jgi:hypothetical protein
MPSERALREGTLREGTPLGDVSDTPGVGGSGEVVVG